MVTLKTVGEKKDEKILDDDRVEIVRERGRER